MRLEMVKQFFTKRRHRKWCKKTIFLLPNIDYFAYRSAEIVGVPKPQFKVLNDTFSLRYYSNMLPSCVRVKCWQKLLQLFHSYIHFLFHSTETNVKVHEIIIWASYLTGFLYHKCFYSYFCIIHKNRVVSSPHNMLVLSCQRPYHVESTGSRPITAVKQRWVWSVLGWVTAWEHQMLLAFCHPLFFRQ